MNPDANPKKTIECIFKAREYLSTHEIHDPKSELPFWYKVDDDLEVYLYNDNDTLSLYTGFYGDTTDAFERITSVMIMDHKILSVDYTVIAGKKYKNFTLEPKKISFSDYIYKEGVLEVYDEDMHCIEQHLISDYSSEEISFNLSLMGISQLMVSIIERYNEMFLPEKISIKLK